MFGEDLKEPRRGHGKGFYFLLSSLSALSVTLDVGHLEYYGFPTALYLERYLHKAKVLHMHGTLERKDHHSLDLMKPEALDMVMKALAEESAPERVMTMEIFSQHDFDSSCSAMQRFLS